MAMQQDSTRLFIRYRKQSLLQVLKWQAIHGIGINMSVPRTEPFSITRARHSVRSIITIIVVIITTDIVIRCDQPTTRYTSLSGPRNV